MELIPVNHDPCRFVARIEDLDQPIKRIFNLRRLIDILTSKDMALVTPRLWDDPREDPTALCMLDGFAHVEGKGQQPLSAYLAPAWAQCWSQNPGSDTWLRAYSRVQPDPDTQRNMHKDSEGVTVTTTVRRLLSAAKEWHEDGADAHVVVGRVEYLDGAEIGQRIVNACNGEHGPLFFRSVQGRADSLLWKRHYFHHEQEVRLLMIDRAWQHETPLPKVRMVRIDPNELFLSMSCDPRLKTFEAIEREQALRDAGYAGEILRDDSYQGLLWQLMMTKDWPNP